MGVGLTVLIPAAGRSGRFAEAGYDRPKWALEWRGKPLLHHILDSVYANGWDAQVLIRREHMDHLRGDLPSETVVVMTDSSDSQLESVGHLSMGAPEYGEVIVHNADLVCSPKELFLLSNMGLGDTPNLVTGVCRSDNPMMSYVRCEENTWQYAEKERISSTAMMGIWYFRSNEDLMEAILDVWGEEEPAYNNEFYLSQALKHIPQPHGVHWVQDWVDVGTPEKYEETKDG